MKDFTYDALPGRVVFGIGTARTRLSDELTRLGADRVLLCVGGTEAPLAYDLVASLRDRVAATFTVIPAAR